MLRINDFILYMPMKGNLTDYSLNGYTATNSGSTSATGENLIANTAYDFNGSTQFFTLTSTVNQAFSTAMNANGAFYISIYLDNGTSTQGIISTYNNTAQNSFNLQYQNVASQELSFPKFNGATNYAWAEGDINATEWVDICYNFTTNDGEQFVNQTSTNTNTYGGTAKENSTNTIWVGRRGDGSYFDGKMYNLMLRTKQLSSLEQKFINKFSNMKRVA